MAREFGLNLRSQIEGVPGHQRPFHPCRIAFTTAAPSDGCAAPPDSPSSARRFANPDDELVHFLDCCRELAVAWAIRPTSQKVVSPGPTKLEVIDVRAANLSSSPTVIAPGDAVSVA